MGGQRVNLKIDISTRSRLSELKRTGETWDGLLNRAADSLKGQTEGRSSIPICSDCGDLAPTWTLRDGSIHCMDCAEVEFPD